MIRVFVIEDHEAIIVAGLKRLFFPGRDGIDITGSAARVEEVVGKVRADDFDLFILDLWLENRLPVANIRTLRKHFPGKPIIIYTSETAIVWKKRMMEEGAMGYMVKSSTRAELKCAIDTVVAGEIFYPVGLQEVHNKKVIVTRGEEEPLITPAEREILHLLAQGYPHKEIAGALQRKPSSLEKALKVLRQRFRAKNNLELLAIIRDRVTDL